MPKGTQRETLWPALSASREKGYALLALLLTVAALGILFVAAWPRVHHWYRQAVLSREAEHLVSDIRFVQQLARTSGRRETGQGEQIGDARPYLDFDGTSRCYRIYGFRQGDGQRWRTVLRRHDWPTGIVMMWGRQDKVLSGGGNIVSTLAFDSNGGTNNFTTYSIYYADDMTRGRHVIIDIVGRVRVTPWGEE